MDCHLHLPLQPMESVASGEAALSENGLCDRFADAKPDEVITYHIGMLARDRDRLATALAPEHRDALELVARRAWAMAEAGLCHLVQRRLGTERFAYVLIVRPRHTGMSVACSPSADRRN
ncbi:MAG: hypothetical protein ING02_04000 [Roseomonas sp.]|nr:hypothetical protein [Roseomonas sp.]